MAQSPDKKEGVPKLFTFMYQHPKTGCFYSLDVQTKEFSAENIHLAQVLAEYERVICDACGKDYNLLDSDNNL